ncbi:MAG: molybdopterin cofactor-binding domain-containing protein [Arhodomonas sp.]|nr:molybdopterin cofactor-binding domain-containing protein [Arhodomonas sp.]
MLTVDEALDADADLLPPRSWRRGEPQAAIAAAPRRLAGTTYVGGQEHFYLEGQVSMAIPQEDGDMLVYSSTQHPSEVQHLVAKVFGTAGSRGHRGDPAHGRRLRRQGDPGRAVRGASRRCSRRVPAGR